MYLLEQKILVYNYVFVFSFTENIVKVTLDGNYNFNRQVGTRAGGICLERQSRSHQGIDTLGRCMVIQTSGVQAANLRLRIDEGTAYR